MGLRMQCHVMLQLLASIAKTRSVMETKHHALQVLADDAAIPGPLPCLPVFLFIVSF